MASRNILTPIVCTASTEDIEMKTMNTHLVTNGQAIKVLHNFHCFHLFGNAGPVPVQEAFLEFITGVRHCFANEEKIGMTINAS